jgi:hypothetical protein
VIGRARPYFALSLAQDNEQTHADQDSRPSYPHERPSKPSRAEKDSEFRPRITRNLFRHIFLEAGAILDRSDAKTGAEDDPHPVHRPESAIKGDGL